MSDVKCPRCRGELCGEYHPGGWVAACNLCGFTGPLSRGAVSALAACASLACFDPRERLPTEEEERSHRERHGEEAGWVIQHEIREDDTHPWVGKWWLPEFAVPADIVLARECEAPDPDWGVHYRHRSWPHVNGRPVAWPEVKP